jgi:streptogramin lyase
MPTGVAVDASGNVYVADTYNQRIQKFTSSGAYLTQWGMRGGRDGQFYYPISVAVDGGGNAYVVDQGNNRIQKFTNDGTYLTQWGTRGSRPGQFIYSPDIAVDGSGRVFVAEEGNDRIQAFTSSGTYLMQWGTYGTGDGQFHDPYGVAVDGSGHVYVADEQNNRIQVFAPLPRDVRVDVKPGDDDNVVNPGANGVLPVAIMSEPHFDATTVDPLTVQLAGARVRVRPNGELMAWSRDVDSDGRADLLLHIESDELALAPSDTTAHLTGQGSNDLVVRGSAPVRVVGGQPRPPKSQAQPLSRSADAAPCLVRAHVLPQGGVVASVRLAAERPARLELLDVTGRRLDTVRLEGGPVNGREYALGPRALAPGIYWVRLEQEGRVSTARVAAFR